ncbi:Uma2 family endonuclease [Plantactinospora sp. WMMB782]|uniref:Uma2 family endonuclease n=1 Tax=Plantactinospora sp. WMMB782 TaxID=3404121 RepID=UPI003B963F55
MRLTEPDAESVNSLSAATRRGVHGASPAVRPAASPGWRVIREIGLHVPGGNAIPDVTVLRAGAPRQVMWHGPEDVALVVEVESPSSRRPDRFTKLGLHAEAGIESYWRIERTERGPDAHLCLRAPAGHCELLSSVPPTGSEPVELPFPVRVSPGAWLP